MLTIRNVVLAIAVFGSAPFTLAAPLADLAEGSIAQYEQRSPSVPEKSARGEPTDVKADVTLNGDGLLNADLDIDGDDEEDVLNILLGRATCYTTSNYKTYEDCNASECPASECTLNGNNRCVWTNKSGSRPSGCSKCKCQKSDS